MVRRVRLEMGCGMMPDLLMIASLVLALTLGSKVMGGFFPMGMLMFTVSFHIK